MFNAIVFRTSSFGMRSLLMSSAKVSSVSGLNQAALPNYAFKGLTTSSCHAAQTATKEEDFFEKNKNLKRPMSPHLTIYQLQITTVMSISHRATGLMLSGLTSGFAIGTLLLPCSFPYYIAILQASHFGPAFLFAAKFSLAFPFMFHLFNGIRHLAWDLGKGFELKSVYASGYAVLGSSLVLAIIAASM